MGGGGEVRVIGSRERGRWWRVNVTSRGDDVGGRVTVSVAVKVSLKKINSLQQWIAGLVGFLVDLKACVKC